LCRKGTFVEMSEHVPARARVTSRLRQLVLHAVTGAGRAVSEVAAAHGLSWRTVQRCVTAAPELAADPDVVAVRRLGIDEHRYRSVRFFRDPARRRGGATNPG
jgi:transposase